MKLNKLSIERQKWGEDKGQYGGEICFDNEQGAITIKLSEEHCQQIFQICADGIIGTAKEAASAMTINIIEHRKSLEDKS